MSGHTLHAVSALSQFPSDNEKLKGTEAYCKLNEALCCEGKSPA